MKCPQCGFENKPGNLFCILCRTNWDPRCLPCNSERKDCSPFQPCTPKYLADKVVLVGMFEHVGRKSYRTFMKVVHRSMKEKGLFLLQTIGRNTSGTSCDPWIAKYIFPNSMLPSIAQIAKSAEGLFVIEDWHNLGPHYDKTLMAWHENFQQAWPRLKKKYDERFKRLWEYYLLSCAGAFRARSIHVWQILMTRHGAGTAQPRCRDTFTDATSHSSEHDLVRELDL